MKKSRRHDTRQPLLDVYLHAELTGHIGRDGSQLWFQYSPGAYDAADPEQQRISIRLPVQPEPISHEETLGFFDNLLLEEDLRAALASSTQHDRRDTAGLLGLVGGECAGAVSVWPNGMRPPRPPQYRACTPDELTDLFATAHGILLTRAQLEARQSMSGAQDKLVIRRSERGYDLPLNGAPGNVLLKRPSARHDGLVHNELAGQRLMEAIGLPAAETHAVGGGGMLLESVRFDRPTAGTSGIGRLHQEDFCQALGRSPLRKYQAQNGPGFADMARVIRAHSANPAQDLERLLRAAIVNIAIGNGDAHAKNFALLYTGEGLRLAPFYDVVSTEAYEHLSRGYSMYIGGAHRATELDRMALERFARDLGVAPRVVHEAIDDIMERLPAAWEGVLQSVLEEADDHPVLQRMDKVIRDNVARLHKAASSG